jgi:2-polyprenyl-3-methyl-5-hydroxy-6-metoxy-1,4-benzoquinol methylase
VLDFGYLHGLFQEFVHRFFSNAHFQICDRPTSPIFTDPAYLELIRQRKYLELIPRDINDLDANMGPYRVILLGEIIEHLDPTHVMEILRKLRKMILPGGALVITTPNGGSL